MRKPKQSKTGTERAAAAISSTATGRAVRSWSLRGALFAIGGASALMAFPQVAEAQLQLGQVQGVVTDKKDGRPMAGVTVVITGPALQGDQTEVTDKGGRYLITQLPSGDNYVVRFYYNDIVVERPGVRIAQNKTLTISVEVPTQKLRGEKLVIRERAPNVDSASASVGVEVNQELLQNTAVRGRTFESAMSLAPGSADVAPRNQTGGDVGVSMGGSTGNENALLIDGMNSTDPISGVLATQVHQFFIKEMTVLTGGYQAEYGRATGGVVSIVTKTGSNEFHGGVFGSWAPYMATPRTVARLGEALGTRGRQFQQYDFGFDLGGPIVKDRIWFYVGFAPTTTINRIERVVRTQTQNGMTGKAMPDPDYQFPSYLNQDIDPATGQPYLARRLDELALQTTEQRSDTYDEVLRLYNWIAKLQFNINPDHNITLGYIGAPEFRKEYIGIRNDVNAALINKTQQIHDATAHYVGKLFSKKLQVDVIYGYHYQSLVETPGNSRQPSLTYRAPASNAYSLADFENAPECARTSNGFNPCPITLYAKDGYGQFKPWQELQRHTILASGTLYGRLGGNHAIKVGFELEDTLSDNTRKYAGNDFVEGDRFSGRYNYTTDAAGTGLRINRGFALPREYDAFGNRGVPCYEQVAGEPTRYCFNQFRAKTETRNYALYLRDQWNIGTNTGLSLNAGLRWEVQEIFGSDGSKQIALFDNLAPRIGATWDPSRKGKGKIYANYGRFYQPVPMDMNDRAFSGEGLLVGGGFTKDCATQPLQPGGRPVVFPSTAVGKPCSILPPRLASSGEFAPVAPGLKGQFIDEVVVGGQYDVGLDVVVGAFFTYRSLGNIIEDLSVDGGNIYFIAAPGQEPDPQLVKQLESELAAAKAAAATNPDLKSKADLAQSKLDVYKAMSLFPKAKRDYYAGTLTINKRLSNRFSLFASYTYSRLLGNYPGSFNPYTNQLDPNISSQYDIIDLLVNRNGPLNNDRPHNLKLTGFYQQPLFGGKGTLTASLTFTALSGRPIQVLGQHSAYGARQTFILPSGSGGRTPMITQLDAHVGYDHQLTEQVKLSVFADIINMLNQREVINVDDEYTNSFVNPVMNGKASDLRRLLAADGTPVIPNPNYGQPTAYQQPIYFRFGARLAF